MGGAGTGKTHSLMRELNAHLEAHPLEQGQTVLALTFMHGSRHRLALRLALTAARRQCECMTFDRFAWDLCRRWRSRLRAAGGFVPLDMDAPDYDATCEAAGRLLADPGIAQWVAARFPVIIVDEFQDCAPVRLVLARCFHGRVKLLVAADDFQNLNGTAESPAVAWIRELGVGEELTVNHRTSDAQLIAAAQALRAGSSLVAGASKSFMLVSIQAAPQAASFISKTMAATLSKDIVVISAAKAGTSPWVDEIIELVRTKQYGPQKVGPIPIRWEMTADKAADAIIAQLGIVQGDGPIGAAAILALPRSPISVQLKRWIESQRRLLGRIEFGAAEMRSQIKRISQHVRSFGGTLGGYRVMTIHQAKNREFPVVLILWPFTVPGEPEIARRWLYNAVTRAKRRAIVFVQDPKKARLLGPPFAYPAKAVQTGTTVAVYGAAAPRR